jgi:hypothetical protein
MTEMLGFETGDSLTYDTVEGRSQHLLVYALHKWLRRADRVLTSMLPGGQFAKTGEVLRARLAGSPPVRR